MFYVHIKEKPLISCIRTQTWEDQDTNSKRRTKIQTNRNRKPNPTVGKNNRVQYVSKLFRIFSVLELKKKCSKFLKNIVR